MTQLDPNTTIAIAGLLAESARRYEQRAVACSQARKHEERLGNAESVQRYREAASEAIIQAGTLEAAALTVAGLAAERGAV